MTELDPKIVVWELTLRCNSQCFHCGSNATKNSREGELNTEESLDLVDQIADIGFERIILSGGEPTLRKDWQKVAEKINENGLELGIISNALAWNDQTISQLIELNPYCIGFSVDGRKDLHNELRGVSTSHEKVFWAIRELKKEEQYVCAITTVNNRNFQDMPRILERLMIYGVDSWQVQLGLPIGRMDQSLVLNEKEHYTLGEFLAKSQENYGGRIKVAPADCIGYYGKLGKRMDLDWQGCWAGIKGLGINSDGTVKGCLSLRSDNDGNVRERPLAEIWQDGSQFTYNRRFSITDLGELCIDCNVGETCKGGCQAQSYAHFESFHNSPYCFLRHEKGGN